MSVRKHFSTKISRQKMRCVTHELNWRFPFQNMFIFRKSHFNQFSFDVYISRIGLNIGMHVIVYLFKICSRKCLRYFALKSWMKNEGK